MNEPSWLANPRNALTSLMHEGVGNCLIAANFFSSGLIPVSDMMCPANSISFPISNFLHEMVMLFVLHLSSTVFVPKQDPPRCLPKLWYHLPVFWPMVVLLL